MRLERKDLETLMRLIDVTDADEIDCEEFLARIAAYLERLGEDGVPPHGSESVVQHLRVCPECLEEVEALHEGLRRSREDAPGE